MAAGLLLMDVLIFVVCLGFFCQLFWRSDIIFSLLFFLLQLSIMAMRRHLFTGSHSQMEPLSQLKQEVTSAGIPAQMNHTLSSPHTCCKGANCLMNNMISSCFIPFYSLIVVLFSFVFL